MIPGFEKIVEERIQSARKMGLFENLPNSGKPLPLMNDSFVREELRLSYKILKNADCLPPEIELKKQIDHIESLLDGMGETEEAYLLLKKLNFLIMKLNTLRQGNVTFELSQQYRDKLARRFGKQDNKLK